MTPTKSVLATAPAPAWGERIRSKTVWTGITMVSGGVVGVLAYIFAGEGDLAVSVMAILNGFGLIFLREALFKGGSV